MAVVGSPILPKDLFHRWDSKRVESDAVGFKLIRHPLPLIDSSKNLVLHTFFHRDLLSLWVQYIVQYIVKISTIISDFYLSPCRPISSPTFKQNIFLSSSLFENNPTTTTTTWWWIASISLKTFSVSQQTKLLGRGVVVSVLTLYSDDPSSIPTWHYNWMTCTSIQTVYLIVWTF